MDSLFFPGQRGKKRVILWIFTHSEKMHISWTITTIRNRVSRLTLSIVIFFAHGFSCALHYYYYPLGLGSVDLFLHYFSNKLLGRCDGWCAGQEETKFSNWKKSLLFIRSSFMNHERTWEQNLHFYFNFPIDFGIQITKHSRNHHTLHFRLSTPAQKIESERERERGTTIIQWAAPIFSE